MNGVPCPICDSQRVKAVAIIEPEGLDDHYRALRCASCGVLFSHPRPSASQDVLQTIYDHSYTTAQQRGSDRDTHEQILYEATNRQMDLVEARVAKGTALNIGAMDIGSLVLRDRGRDVDVIDVSEHAAQIAAERWGLQVIVGKIEDVQLQRRHYDFVKVGHVIEHLQDPAYVLAKLHASMKDDGIILIDTDNALGMRSRIEYSMRSLVGERLASSIVRRVMGKNSRKRYGRLAPPVHLFTFTPTSLTGLLRRSGFSIEFILEPAWGDATWFPIHDSDRLHVIERLFLLIDRAGAKLLGHGEVLVVAGRKVSDIKDIAPT
jgi:2-polyprenyl-3-methyl-5-hydroxy-6-metoxy-1,4-benzoquinol methylase